MKRKERIRLGVKRKWSGREYAVISLLFGGVGYGLLELLWRGYTHPSMVLTGGICFMGILFLNRKLLKLPLLLRGAVCALLVTAVEFVVGLVVNRILHLNVWDYSWARYHVMGQICTEYSFFWFLLCTALSFAFSSVFQRERT